MTEHEQVVPIEELVLDDLDGGKVRLADLWAKRPLAVVLVRHYNCLHCRFYAMQLERDREQIEETGCGLVLIGMGTPEEAARFKQQTKLTFPLLVSGDGAAYRAFELKEGGLTEIFSPKALGLGVVRALGRDLHGHNIGIAKGGNLVAAPPQQNWKQLGGVFVITPDGKVVWSHRAKHSGDNPSSEELIAALQLAPLQHADQKEERKH